MLIVLIVVFCVGGFSCPEKKIRKKKNVFLGDCDTYR